MGKSVASPKLHRKDYIGLLFIYTLFRAVHLSSVELLLHNGQPLVLHYEYNIKTSYSRQNYLVVLLVYTIFQQFSISLGHDRAFIKIKIADTKRR